MSHTRLVTQIGAGEADLDEPQPKPTALTDGLVEASTTIWESPDGRTSVGIWECSPGSFTAIRDGYTETCQILRGRVTLRSDAGGEVTVGAGDTIVMPDGWSGIWHVHEAVRKTYVTVTT